MPLKQYKKFPRIIEDHLEKPANEVYELIETEI